MTRPARTQWRIDPPMHAPVPKPEPEPAPLLGLCACIYCKAKETDERSPHLVGQQFPFVKCANCQCRGPIAPDAATAIAQWNAPQRFGQPITRDEERAIGLRSRIPFAPQKRWEGGTR